MNDSPALRVMSFNVLNGHRDGHMAPWAQRRSAAAAAIREVNPDLLAIQELQPFQARDLRSAMSDYAFVGRMNLRRFSASEGVAVFFRADRFPLLEQGCFWLSKTPDIPGSRSWMSITPRMACWVRLADRCDSGRELVFFSTHFDPISLQARWRSAKLLRKRVGQIAGGSPIIVAGDFNAHGGRRTHAFLVSRENEGPVLLDSFRCVHPRPRRRREGTWHGGRGIRTHRRIDWILHSRQFVTTDAAIERFCSAGQYPSDHYPVTASLVRQPVSESAVG